MNEKFRTQMWLGAAIGCLTLVSGAMGAPATPPGSYQIAALFGESDEERAARLAAEQHEQAQDASIRYLRQRNDDLESTVRRLTGELEQQDHRITELNNRIDRMQKDFDYKL